MCQLCKATQRIQIRQLAHLVLGQDQCRQTWYLLVKGWLEGSDAIARQEKGVEAWEVREVCECGDVVVGEVD